MENIPQIMEHYGIMGLIVVQLGSIIRTWITSKKNRTQNNNIGSTILLMEKEIKSMQITNKKEHSLLADSYKRIDDRIEHNNFIPAYEININTYYNEVIQGSTFQDKELKGIAMSLSEKSIDIFLSILKIGFINYDKSFIINMFDSQLMRLNGIIASHNIKNNKEIIHLLSHAQEGFLISINKVIENNTNGTRQKIFKELTENYLFNLIREISKL